MWKSVGLVCSIVLSGQLQADVLAVVIGAESWYNRAEQTVIDSLDKQFSSSDKQYQQAIYLKFEHPLPLLPNVALRQQKVSQQTSVVLATDVAFGAQPLRAGTTVNVSLDGYWQDLTAYYELADNSLLELDVGLTLRRLDLALGFANTAVKTQYQLERWRPLLFVDTELAVLGTDTSLFASAAYSKTSDDFMRDMRAGFAWRWLDVAPLQGFLKIGYQHATLNLDAVNTVSLQQSQRGPYAALEFDF